MLHENGIAKPLTPVEARRSRRRCATLADVELVAGGAADDGVTDRITFCPNIQLAFWNVYNIRYYFQNLTSDDPDPEAIVRSAFNKWASVIPRTFNRVYTQSQANITISFVRDVEGGVADAYCGGNTPGTPAPIRFEQHLKGNDLCNAALQEIGHTLGLDHSTEKDSVMWPQVRGTTDLHYVDIKGIRSLYPVVIQTDEQMIRVNLHATAGTGCAVTAIVFPEPARRLAWCNCTMVDSLKKFDRDNAWAIEVYRVSGTLLPYRLYGGPHWGQQPGWPSNVYPSSWIGQNVTSVWFRLSAEHSKDLEAFGVGCVLTL